MAHRHDKIRVSVGTKNEAKIRAVKSALSQYEMLNDAEVSAHAVSSGVSHQPLSMEEVIKGAKNRAKNCFQDCDYGIGLESGLIDVPQTKSGKMDICACVIYDGNNFHLGLSCAFELPKEVQKLVDRGFNITDASNKTGLTDNPKLGEAEGLIGILTKGRIKREDYTKQAIITALIQIENKELYS